MRLSIAVFALAGTLFSFPLHAEESAYPLESVTPGLRGEGRTVFSGTTVVTFDVEVVGVLRNVAPKRNLIVARLSGADAIEKGGVYGGMSGSPVYVDGKFLGAIAQTWAFAKEPLAGITPAGEMLELLDRPVPSLDALPGAFPGTTKAALSASAPAPSYTLGDFFDRKSLTLEDTLKTLSHPSAAGMEALPMPLVFSGFGQKYLGNVSSAWSASGFMPVQGASAGGSAMRGEKAVLVPGSPVGAQLMRGDMEIAAVGTLTYISGDRLLAFGHPFLGLGAISMPLVASRIEALVPRSQVSFKMASTLETVGAIVRDAEAGIVGILGRRAEMVPVRLAVTLPEGKKQNFNYEVVAHPLLAPSLAAAGVDAVLSGVEQSAGAQTFEIEGSIALRGHPSVRLKDMVASEAGAREMAFIVSAYLGVLYNSGLEVPVVEGVDLDVKMDNHLRSAFLTAARVPRTKVKAGDVLRVEADLRPHQERSKTISIKVEIPTYLKGRKVSLFISDSMTLTRLEAPRRDYFPGTLDELIRVLNGLRDNRNLYVHLVEWKPSYIVEGRLFMDLPSSVRALQRSPAQAGGTRDIPVTYLTELRVPTDYHVRGFFQIPLEVQ